uniref:Uncharacterized protein n=1 Tax=Aegilops tauschii subsp. strangulata TaxID=200361 RepID=A0A452YL42_AEGTS
YWDDKYNTESVSEEVLDEMRTLMTEELGHNASEGAFLLDDEIRYMCFFTMPGILSTIC